MNKWCPLAVRMNNAETELDTASPPSTEAATSKQMLIADNGCKSDWDKYMII